MKKPATMILGDLCSLITDGKHGDCKDQDGSGYYFISAKDISDGRINYDNARQITYDDFIQTHKRTDLKPGDVLLTNSGTIGRLAIASHNGTTDRATFQKSVAILKPIKEKILSQFLYYSLAFSKTSLVNSASGAAQKNLLLGDLKRFPIQVPALFSQGAIVKILSAYDDLIENNRRRMQLLEQAARLLYQEWFVRLRFPGHEHSKIKDSVPEGWERVPLSQMCTDIRQQVDPTRVAPDTPYIGLEHIPRRSITLQEWGRASDVESSKFMFVAGDIIFGKIRPYFHKVVFTLTDGIASSDAIVIRPSGNWLYEYVLFLISSDEFVALASKTVREGSKMPRADWKFLSSYSFLCPTQEMAFAFSETTSPIVSQLRVLALQNRQLTKARDLLLPRLMNGAIAV